MGKYRILHCVWVDMHLAGFLIGVPAAGPAAARTPPPPHISPFDGVRPLTVTRPRPAPPAAVGPRDDNFFSYPIPSKPPNYGGLIRWRYFKANS
ncbi:hypothetical protein EVAR_68442_1 [Eumeta japonica]|uniref:Uncharacterized protein n=1 Tax=Eumeta variegata TaxID=151549 RepID=A0A4C1ZWM1_EUMVA|nr:hypothetical protein EVAR_68442_1 [Eumeta japonica]